MSSLIVEKDSSIIIASKAVILPEDREIASSWASKYVYRNPGFKWILGNFAEADNPNRNKQMIGFSELAHAQQSIQHTPMNLIHTKKAVGTFVRGEMIYPNEEMASLNANPYLEALSVFWKYAFNEDYKMVEMAHEAGQLFYSMEAVPTSLNCAGENGCGAEFAYRGPKSDTYCDHINNLVSDKKMIDPVFVGGALIVPPTQPGWSNAAIKELASFVDNDKNSTITDNMYDFLVDETNQSESENVLTMRNLLSTFRLL